MASASRAVESSGRHTWSAAALLIVAGACSAADESPRKPREPAAPAGSAAPALVAIEFMGRIVDQHGQPVRGAKIEYATRGDASGSRMPGTTQSDDHGLFRVRGRGWPVLELTGMSAAGHQIALYAQPNGFSRDGDAGAGLGAWLACNDGKPCEYRAFCYPDDADRSALSHGRARASLPANGEPFSFAIFDLRPTVKPGPGRGEIELDFRRERDAANEEHWTLKVRVPNGGIQPAEGPYTNVAPDGGYRDEVSVTGTAATAYQLVHYFVKLPKGAFARVTLWLRTRGFDDRARLSIDYSLNEQGKDLETFDGWPEPAVRHRGMAEDRRP